LGDDLGRLLCEVGTQYANVCDEAVSPHWGVDFKLITDFLREAIRACSYKIKIKATAEHSSDVQRRLLDVE
jgi:hypothetical protein